ncbi:MAG: YndJ family transporter [Planctomycetaceae bacterium]
MRLIATGIRPAETEWAVTLLLLSPLIIAPLVLATVGPVLSANGETVLRRAVSYQLARRLQLPGALLLWPAVALPASAMSAALCLPWLIVTFLLAGTAARDFYSRKRWAMTELMLCSGLLFLPIGAGWLVMWRLGLRPLGFKEVIVMLTAIHFHFAGFVLPLLAGWCAQSLPGRVTNRVGLSVMGGVPAVAVGITTTQLGFSPWIEVFAAAWLSLSGMAVALQQIIIARRQSADRLARSLLFLSSLSLLGTMGLSMLYGLRCWHDWDWLDIPWMRAWHGTGNALFACLLAVIGWARLQCSASQRRLSETPRSSP